MKLSSERNDCFISVECWPPFRGSISALAVHSVNAFIRRVPWDLKNKDSSYSSRISSWILAIRAANHLLFLVIFAASLVAELISVIIFSVVFEFIL